MFPRSCDTSSETRSAAPGWGTASGETCAVAAAGDSFTSCPGRAPWSCDTSAETSCCRAVATSPVATSGGHMKGSREQRWRREYKMEKRTEQIIYDGGVLPRPREWAWQQLRGSLCCCWCRCCCCWRWCSS